MSNNAVGPGAADGTFVKWPRGITESASWHGITSRLWGAPYALRMVATVAFVLAYLGAAVMDSQTSLFAPKPELPQISHDLVTVDVRLSTPEIVGGEHAQVAIAVIDARESELTRSFVEVGSGVHSEVVVPLQISGSPVWPLRVVALPVSTGQSSTLPGDTGVAISAPIKAPDVSVEGMKRLEVLLKLPKLNVYTLSVTDEVGVGLEEAAVHIVYAGLEGAIGHFTYDFWGHMSVTIPRGALRQVKFYAPGREPVQVDQNGIGENLQMGQTLLPGRPVRIDLSKLSGAPIDRYLVRCRRVSQGWDGPVFSWWNAPVNESTDAFVDGVRLEGPGSYVLEVLGLSFDPDEIGVQRYRAETEIRNQDSVITLSGEFQPLVGAR